MQRIQDGKNDDPHRYLQTASSLLGQLQGSDFPAAQDDTLFLLLLPRLQLLTRFSPAHAQKESCQPLPSPLQASARVERGLFLMPTHSLE